MTRNSTPGRPALTVIAPDKDAREIAELYRQGKQSMVDSVRFFNNCGQRLIEKKAALKAEFGHGSWLPWLADNADVLGFDSRRTASRLMALAAKWDVDVPYR
jgi:hypothetical protein